MAFPILIPSKKRPESNLFGLLADDKLDFLIVVEPQDVEAYSKWSKNLLVLPDNNRGLVFSRNFILDFARKEKIDWFWMSDDDVKSFYVATGGKNVKVNPKEAFHQSERIFMKGNDLAQCAMEYQQFSWCQKKSYTINSYCDVVVCINTKNTKGVKYRESVTLKEDRDFTLQCLANGYKTLRTSYVAFSCPKNGSNEGGLYDVYRSGLEKKSVDEMCRIWGNDICSPVVKKDGRRDAKINWSYFK